MKKQESRQQMYTITCTEEQLHIIAAAVEDWHRFLVGQCDMNYATSYLDKRKAMQGNLRQLEGIVPHSDWCGSGIDDKHHRKAIAQSYGIYRQILHYLATKYPSCDFNVYNYETPTCEDNMPLIKVEKKGGEKGVRLSETEKVNLIESTPLADVGLKTHTKNSLCYYFNSTHSELDEKTLGDLAKLKMREFRKCRHVGKATCDDVRNVLGKYGLTLEEEQL